MTTPETQGPSNPWLELNLAMRRFGWAFAESVGAVRAVEWLAKMLRRTDP